MKSDIIDIACIIKRKTERAALIDHGGKEPVWLPLSQIEICKSDDGKTDIVSLPEWLARDKGLI